MPYFFKVLDISYIKPAGTIGMSPYFWAFPAFSPRNIRRLKEYDTYKFRKDHPAIDAPGHPLYMSVAQVEDGGYFKIKYTLTHNSETGEATMWDAIKIYALPVILEPQNPVQSKIYISACSATPEDFKDPNNFKSIMNNTIHQGENKMKIRVNNRQIKSRIKSINTRITQAANSLLANAQEMAEKGNITEDTLRDVSAYALAIDQLQKNLAKVAAYSEAQELIMDEEEYANFTNL